LACAPAGGLRLASAHACGRAHGAERGGRGRPAAFARACNRSWRQKAAPSIEQSREGRAGLRTCGRTDGVERGERGRPVYLREGRWSRAGREGPACGRTSAGAMQENFSRRLERSKNRTETHLRLTCEERRKGVLRIERGTERSGLRLFFEPNGSVFLKNILLCETTPLCIFSTKR
jgi:hypothetical protein